MKLKKFDELNEEFLLNKTDDKKFRNTLTDIVYTKNNGRMELKPGIEISKKGEDALLIKRDDGTEITLYLNVPSQLGKNERVSFFHPKSGGSTPLKVSKELAQEVYDDLVFYTNTPNDVDPKSDVDADAVSKTPVEPSKKPNKSRLGMFLSAVEKMDSKNQKSRIKELSNTFFAPFIGSDLMGSQIVGFSVYANKEGDYYGMDCKLADGGKFQYSYNNKTNNDNVTIVPSVNPDLGPMDDRKKYLKDKEKVSKKDARIIGKITKMFNPRSTYFNGTGDLIVKEYESKRNISGFEDFQMNEKFADGDSERSIDLRGPSGNAFAIIGMAKDFCKQLKSVDPEKYDFEKIYPDMVSGDYKHLVLTFEELFGDFVTIYNADVLDEQ